MLLGKVPTAFSVLQRAFSSSSRRFRKELKSQYDAVVVGAGHNGLVAAAYLQKAGLNVCVLERRHLIGGAAVTEEIVPGYKFSRASYVLSLLRPQIFKDLELKKHGLKVYLRDPNSYTPILGAEQTSGPKSLTLGRDSQQNQAQIAQFSAKDAKAFIEYEESLERMVSALEPLLDTEPVRMSSWVNSTLREKWKGRRPLQSLVKTARDLGSDLPDFYEILTAPAIKVLRKWFESEPLIATLATDSVIGAMYSPYTPGSGYVLLHHVMGELEGIKGAWGYAEGGMGAVSQAIANSASEAGAHIFTNQVVDHIMVDSRNKANGVTLADGTEIKAKVVLSNATPKVTYLDLLHANDVPEDFRKDVQAIDYTSPVTKINVAVNRLPNFLADPNTRENEPMPHHRATIHLNCEDTEFVHQAFSDAQAGIPSRKAVIEMTIPSSLDPTLAPPGCHVVQLFTQYTPYTLAGGKAWDQETTNQYADSIFDTIEQYAPGFKASVVGRDVLTPPELERVFGLTGGNIFHGSMSLDQLYTGRPLPAYCDYRSPVNGLYLCGSGAHPGGGVMGSPGRLGAQAVIQDLRI